MSSAWYASIQEQINKSFLEASKIAEEASKYDILNFDGMINKPYHKIDILKQSLYN